MQHSPAMHSPHIMRPANHTTSNQHQAAGSSSGSGDGGSSFTPVSSGVGVPTPDSVQQHPPSVPTPERPMSTHTPSMPSSVPPSHSPLTNGGGKSAIIILHILHLHVSPFSSFFFVTHFKQVYGLRL